MGALFSRGAKNNNRVDEHDRAILDLKVQRDRLKQYQKKVEAVIERERDVAQQLLKQGKRDRALLALKKKRLQEKLLEKTDKQLANLQEMVDSIEFAKMEQQVFEGLKEGNKVLKQIHSIMSVEDVENLLLDTQEAIEEQKRIEDLLSGGLSSEDNADVEEELERIISEETLRTAPTVPSEPLPDTQTDRTAVSAEKSEKAKQKAAVLAT